MEGRYHDLMPDGDEPYARGSVDTVPMVASVAELWLLQRCIRHELPAQETWKFPPASVELNDQIAAALLFCQEQNVGEAALRLSWGDLLAIDYAVPADAKDVNGRAIGREVLLKSFAARAALRRPYPLPDAADSTEPSSSDVQQRLATHFTAPPSTTEPRVPHTKEEDHA
ncbi:MAG TPA: hypothetical protein VKV26_20750 [Dehalococcoidia bacterium]|nr:hypothetical protein [Dehalococcoidia bacterium]